MAPRKTRRRKPLRRRAPLSPATVEQLATAEPITGDGLTSLEELFVLEYLVDFNATRAYLRSHPRCSRPTTASTEGWRMLRKPWIARAVDAGRGAQHERLKMNADEALAIISRNARADLGDAYADDGQLLPFAMWPEMLRRSVRVFDPATGKVTLYDGQRAAELMAQAGGKLKTSLVIEFDHAGHLAALSPLPAEPPKP